MYSNTRLFQNVGYALYRFTEEELKPIWDEIHAIQADSSQVHTMNHELAGNIKYEFELTQTFDYIEKLVSPKLWQFNNVFNYPNSLEVLTEPKPLRLDRPWVNIMHKHEFNPIHNHSGVMSFVIWMDVPYTLAEEHAMKPWVPAHTNLAGQFALHYIDTLGHIKSEAIKVDKSYNGVMCMFPSGMHHSVFPFYSSDKPRISVAGNFIFDLRHNDEGGSKYDTDSAWVEHEPSPLALSSDLNGQQLVTNPVPAHKEQANK